MTDESGFNKIICDDPSGFGHQPLGLQFGKVFRADEPFGTEFGMGFGAPGPGYGYDSYGCYFYGSVMDNACYDTTAPIVTVVSLIPDNNKVSLIPGFNQATLTWNSNESGEYQIEVNGTGRGYGLLVETGVCGIDTNVVSYIDGSDLVPKGQGIRRINIYVTDEAGNTTPYDDER